MIASINGRAGTDGQQDDSLATVAEAAKFLALSRSSLYELMDAGRLSYARIPGTGSRCSRRIPWRRLREFVQRSMVEASAGESVADVA
jgi:excisionase family DNA binding protein